VNNDEELQRELTAAALTALDGRAFALAGSGAIREHGMVDRLTHDVDLFTNDLDPAAFESAVDQLTNELHRAGHDVEEVRRSPQFAQLRITTPEGRSVDMDLAVDQRGALGRLFSGDLRMRVVTVVGARPQFIKAAVVSRILRQRPGVERGTVAAYNGGNVGEVATDVERGATDEQCTHRGIC